MNQNYIIGLDVGGSKIAGVLVKNNEIVKSADEKTPQEREGILKVLFKLIDELSSDIDKSLITGIGIAAAGVIDDERGIILKSPNISAFDGFEIKKEIESVLNIEVRICNDVDCFLLAESRLGAGQGYNNVLAVALGTGVGGGIMINGEIIKGKHGSAGEVGHMIISRLSAEEGVGPIRGGLLSFEDLCSRKWFESINKKPKEIEDSARLGDEESLKIYQKLGKNLGIGLANLVNILDPEVIILGGGIARAYDIFASQMRSMMRKLIISPQAMETEVILNKFGKFSAALGASLLFE